MSNSPLEPANGKDVGVGPPRYKKPTNTSTAATFKPITTVPPVTTAVTGTIPRASVKSGYDYGCEFNGSFDNGGGYLD